MNLPKARAYIATWLHRLAGSVDSEWGKAGFNSIYYQGEPLEPDHEASRGRVTKITAPPEFDPDAPKKQGGHVVKRMPRQLQKIKEGQDATGVE